MKTGYMHFFVQEGSVIYNFYIQEAVICKEMINFAVGNTCGEIEWNCLPRPMCVARKNR